MRLLWVAVAVTLACGRAADSDAGSEYITVPKDTDASKDAKESREFQCQEGMIGMEDLEEEREDRREALLDAVGGDNIIRTVLEESKTPDETGTKFAEHATTGWLISKAGPLILFFLMLVVYFLCCWTAWPCCKCIRVCAKERKSNMIVFFVSLILVCGVALGIIGSSGAAVAGHHSVADGFHNMGCAVSRLLDYTLNGVDNPQFIGMLPMLRTFEKLDGLLDDGSAFVTDVNTMMDNTKTMDLAVTGTAETLGLLSATLSNAANLNPSAGGSSLFHKCEFCEKVSEAVTPVKAELESGAGASLNGARNEVKSQLQGDAKTDLQSTLQAAAQPIMMVKNMFIDTFGGLVGPDLEDLQASVAGPAVEFAIVLVLLCGLALSAFAMLAFISYFLCTAKRKTEVQEADKPERNPYSKIPIRLALCTWCCGFYLVFFALLLGGILTMITVPMSGLCLIMDDISSTTLKAMGGGLGMNMSAGADDMDMVLDIIDNCFAAGSASGNANLLDIVKTTDANGTKSSLRKEIVESVKDQIKGQFAEASSKMTSGNGTALATSDGVVKLRAMLKDNDVRVMIVPTQELIGSSTYNPLAGSSNTALKNFGITSTNCADATPAGISGATQAVQGISTFDTALATLGSSVVANVDSCAKNVVCAPGANNAICQAGNSYIDLKQSLRNTAVYRCDLFENPNNPAQYCDPKDMAADYTNDCMTKTNGDVVPLKVKAKSCTLAEFVTYVQEYDLRLKKVFERLDTTVASVGPQITGNLQSLVDQYILQEIDTVADGAGCGFLGLTYRAMVDGFCFQGVYGLVSIAGAYVATAVLVLILIVVMYILWRISADNYNKWQAGVLV
eukprot:TRINITY_DN3000_c0_g1_i1.p1 TRINITY_DN3000_c0_g1~~TRINITY_DN3000_c0_g1_i1.p1  ORF type:complete len:846 (+),score=247.23 TRINITY_DN3000_c0_g1_i1:107-2644(+)